MHHLKTGKPSLLACLLYLSVALLQVNTVLAQSAFENGYLVTFRGDSLQGLIDSQHWLEGTHLVRFKDAPESPVQTFTPREVASFYVDGEWYESKTVTVDETPLKIRVEMRETRPSSREATVFLAVVVKGPLSLYTFHDTRPHYYIESDDSIDELIAHEYIVIRNGRYAVFAEEGYKEQIRRFQMRCPSVAISDVTYTRRFLSTFVAQCGQEIAPGKVQARNEIRVRSVKHGVLAGASRAKLEFAKPYFHDNVSFNPSYSISVGYFIDLQIRGRGTESILLGVQLRRLSIDDTEPSISHSEFCPVSGPCTYSRHYTTWSGVRIHTAELETFAAGRLRLSKHTVRPFIELGGTFSTPLIFDTEAFAATRIYALEPGEGPTNQWVETEEIFRERTELPIEQRRKYTLSALAGIGLEYDKLSLIWRMEQTMGFGGARAKHAPLWFAYLLVGYTF